MANLRLSRPATPANMPATYRLSLAGAIALLLGIGLGRFAYTPIIPPLVEAGWFTSQQAAYLGAVNLLGYMLGAWVAHRTTLWFGERRVLAANLALLTVSFFACALDWGFAWYSVWRLLAGVTAAILTVVAAPAVMARVPAARRPGASAIVFTGIGAGVIASGTLVPWLAGYGVVAAWLGIGAVSVVLALWSWRAVWRDLAPIEHAASVNAAPATIPRTAVLLIIVAYGLCATGIVPHALFWVDYIARELGRGLQTGGVYWVVFGVGGMLGPLLAGVWATRVGFRPALVSAIAAATLAVGLPVVSSAAWALALSSLVVGAMVPATVALTAGSVAELSPPGRQQQLWGWATLSFAVMQAISGYALSWAYDLFGSYWPLFGIGAAALALGVLSAGAGAMRAVDDR